MALEFRLETPPRTWGRPYSCNVTLWRSETPPRTWGRRRRQGRGRPRLRNTPTHVGKTLGGIMVSIPLPKHPHARGEDIVYRNQRERNPETPPRTWGRPGAERPHLPRYRNTPTHVGKTREGADPLPFARETPPRTWGRQPIVRLVTKMERNTPTHVGKTPPWAPCWLTRWETPPRTWGRHCREGEGVSHDGNTPTHVGKTVSSPSLKRLKKKHPHARGEDPSRARGGKSCGKHPHARGEDEDDEWPAYTTGETPPRTWGRPCHPLH